MRIAAGTMIGGYQAQAQAPLDYIRGSRQRVIGGRYVTGAWADPWWVYDPQRGWAIAKRWRHRAQTAIDRAGGKWVQVQVPAADEIVIEPVTPAAA